MGWLVQWLLLPYMKGVDLYLAALIYSLITVALAALSWRFLEGPINRQRDQIASFATAALMTARKAA